VVEDFAVGGFGSDVFHALAEVGGGDWRLHNLMDAVFEEGAFCGELYVG